MNRYPSWAPTCAEAPPAECRVSGFPRLAAMPGLVIVGAQWGDEGKGKVVDLLAERGDAVIRFQGGNNAGHTIVLGDEVYKLHLIPCLLYTSDAADE